MRSSLKFAAILIWAAALSLGAQSLLALPSCTTTITTVNNIAISFNALSAGQTLCLSPGTYNQSSSLSKSGSAAGGYITVTCSTGNAADCTVTVPSNTSGTNAFYVTGSYDEIEGLTITGGDWGILFNNGANHDRAYNNIVSGSACAGIEGLCGDYYDFQHNTITQAGKVATNSCSAMSIYEPVASDALSGTHIYVGYNIWYANGNPTNGTDGEGLDLDDFAHSQAYCGTGAIHTASGGGRESQLRQPGAGNHRRLRHQRRAYQYPQQHGGTG